jgi:hypothetical protein
MTNATDNSDSPQDLERNPITTTGRSARSDLAVDHLYRRRKKKKKRHDHDGHPRHRKDDGEKEDKPSTTVTTVATVPEDEVGPFFFVDRKGDPQNVVYGGNPTGFTPRYRRAGYGSVMGVDKRYRISEDGSKASGIRSTNDGRHGAHASSLLTFREKSIDAIDQVKAETIEGEIDGIRLQHEYIAVGPSKRRKRDLAEGTIEGAPPDEGSPGSSDTTTESDTSAAEEEDLYDKFRNDVQRQRLLELNRATVENPTDIETWLTLVAYQDDLIDDYAPRDRASNSTRQSLAEVKLALYEKALTKVSDPKSRDQLTTGLMEQGAIVWDIDMLTKKWQGVIQSSSSIGLWIHYVNFRQSHSAKFSYESCLSSQGDSLRRARDEPDLQTRERMSIYLVLRLTMLMSQSGYSERAIAIWQSLLEYAFFRPSQLDLLTEQSSFQSFWESEVPRIGESGAVGWALSKPLDVPSRSDPVPGHTSPGNKCELWALRECEVAASSTMPARTLDDVAEDDPFRVVLYSDIEDFLFTPNPATNHTLLITALLKFCGLPSISYPGSEAQSGWWGDEFVSHCFRGDETWPIECTAMSDTMTLFSAESSLSAFPVATEEGARSKVSWQRTALKQLAAIRVDDDHLAEYVIAYEASLDLKEGRKYAKSLLKNRPSHLRLYNAYALLECRLDRFESATHVWSTAITMSPSASVQPQQDIMLLWSSWVFECLRQNDIPRAVMIFSSIPDGQVATGKPTSDAFSSAAVRLRTRTSLDSHLAQQLSLRREDRISYPTELLAIFEYLCDAFSIPAALAVYNTTFDSLRKTPASSQLIEVLHQSRARLLHIHPTLSPRGYRPAEINKHLAEPLSSFPSNSMFHRLYQEHTERSGLLERIREIVPMRISEEISHNSSIIPYLFAIQKELGRPSYAGSTHHSIRAAFERGVAAAKASVHIWSWYIRWEASLINETEPVPQAAKPGRKRDIQPPRNKAVDVYYRGIRACPWAKELYMLGFSDAGLRKAIGGDELRKVYDVMLEKGLRVHVDLEQMLQ